MYHFYIFGLSQKVDKNPELSLTFRSMVSFWWPFQQQLIRRTLLTNVINNVNKSSFLFLTLSVLGLEAFSITISSYSLQRDLPAFSTS